MKEKIKVNGHTRKERGRKPLPEDLPQVEVVHDIDEQDRVCDCDGVRLGILIFILYGSHMVHKPRIHYPGAFYHVMLHSNGGQDIFFSDADHSLFHLLLQEGVGKI